MSLFQHVPHPHIERLRHRRPVRVVDQHKRTGAFSRFNSAVAVMITDGVGTMTCAYVFAAIALLAFPQAIHDTFVGSQFHPLPLVTWISQAFLQLVLLSVIMVGQNVLASASDKRAEETYQDAEAVLHEALQIQEHLLIQDHALEVLADKLGTQLGSAPSS
jgi:hypothetical protein